MKITINNQYLKLKKQLLDLVTPYYECHLDFDNSEACHYITDNHDSIIFAEDLALTAINLEHVYYLFKKLDKIIIRVRKTENGFNKSVDIIYNLVG